LHIGERPRLQVSALGLGIRRTDASDPQAVKVTLDNGVLTLSGERRQEHAAISHGTENALQQERRERLHGRFYRRFILPDTADAENVSATGRNGVLEVSIREHPKAQQSGSLLSNLTKFAARTATPPCGECSVGQFELIRAAVR
jgi:hypothetical protein